MNPAEEGRFDDVFLPVLSHLGKMDGFLEHIFNFLSRRTDFYRIMKSKTDTIGFMPGVSEQLVRNYFMKYERMARNEDAAPVPSPSGGSSSAEISTRTDVSDRGAPIQHMPAVEHPGSAVHAVAADVTVATTAGTETTAAAQPRMDSSDVYNGDTTDRYSWSQTATDIDIKVLLPAGTKASQLHVSFQQKHITVGVRKSSGAGEDILLEGELSEQIRPSECMWSKDGNFLQLSLEKQRDFMWKTVFKGDKEIDLNHIDNTRQLTDYDEETQTGVRKAMYDQERRMKGLPTSDEQKTLSVLQKAWDAEGSPFQGTPYDPSAVNLSGSSVGGLPPFSDPS